MKRILLLNYEYPPLGGGAANALEAFLREFTENKDYYFDVVVSSGASYSVDTLSSNITLHRLDIGKRGDLQKQSLLNILVYSLKSYFYCRKLKTKNEYDFIHAWFGVPCGLIAFFLGLPYVISLLGSDVPFSNPKFRFLDRLFLRGLSRFIWSRAKFVTVNSAGMLKKAKMTMPDGKFITIVNGVDCDFFLPAKKVPLSGRTYVLAACGRLAKVKGFDSLIEALHGCADVKLLLLGDGPEKEYLKGLAKEKAVDVRFLGFLNRFGIRDAFQSADVFVLSSVSEGMSNALLEAMSCGLPVVSSRVGGTDELIQGNGILYDSGDIEALRSALIHLRDNEELLHRMAGRSREIAESLSWTTMTKEYVKIYESQSLTRH